MFKKVLNTIILSLKGYSLLRIYQIHASKTLKLNGKSIEFGAFDNKSKNFSNYFSGSSTFLFSNFHNRKGKDYLKIDLTKKIKLEKNQINNIIILNVIEHLSNYELIFKETHRILKKEGNLIGSTPFIYQVHGAPNDYFRFTRDFFEMSLKKNKFKKIKIQSLGFGPFIACYSLIHPYIKFFPVLKEVILLFSFLLDFLIQMSVKTKLNEIYPIGYFFTAKK